MLYLCIYPGIIIKVILKDSNYGMLTLRGM